MQVRAHARGVGLRTSRDDQLVSRRVHLQECHSGMRTRESKIFGFSAILSNLWVKSWRVEVLPLSYQAVGILLWKQMEEEKVHLLQKVLYLKRKRKGKIAPGNWPFSRTNFPQGNSSQNSFRSRSQNSLRYTEQQPSIRVARVCVCEDS